MNPNDIIPEAVVTVSPNAARPVDSMPLTIALGGFEWVINVPIEEYREAMGLMPTPPHWKRW